MWRAWRRWQDRRRHGDGPWGGLFAAPPERSWVSLDLETTGLDPARDRILSIAAVPIVGDRMKLSERFEAILRPAADAPPPALDALRHHRLRPHDLAGGLDPHEAIARLLDWLGPRTLVGYRIGFDVAMLDRLAPAVTGFVLPHRRIDIAARYRARHRHRAPESSVDDAGFEAIAAALGVPQLGRHTALGDATTAALCWLALQAGR